MAVFEAITAKVHKAVTKVLEDAEASLAHTEAKAAKTPEANAIRKLINVIKQTK